MENNPELWPQFGQSRGIRRPGRGPGGTLMHGTARRSVEILDPPWRGHRQDPGRLPAGVRQGVFCTRRYDDHGARRSHQRQAVSLQGDLAVEDVKALGIPRVPMGRERRSRLQLNFRERVGPERLMPDGLERQEGSLGDERLALSRLAENRRAADP